MIKIQNFPEKEHLDNFARRGLRTLCYSFNFIDEITYKKWEKKYNDLKYHYIVCSF